MSQCAILGKSGTLTTVEYDFVGVSEDGNREFIKRAEHPKQHAREVERWARFISHCLKRAKTRPHDHAQATAEATT